MEVSYPSASPWGLEMPLSSQFSKTCCQRPESSERETMFKPTDCNCFRWGGVRLLEGAGNTGGSPRPRGLRGACSEGQAKSSLKYKLIPRTRGSLESALQPSSPEAPPPPSQEPGRCPRAADAGRGVCSLSRCLQWGSGSALGQREVGEPGGSPQPASSEGEGPDSAVTLLLGSGQVLMGCSACASQRPGGQSTHPHVLGVVGQALQPLDDGVPVLLPFPLAEHDLQEVPRPADERHVKQLPLCEDFGTLEGGGRW